MNFKIRTIKPTPPHNSIWYLENEEGEGMSISDKDLIAFIKAENKETWFYKNL